MKKLLMLIMLMIASISVMNCGSGQTKEDAPAAECAEGEECPKAEEAPAE